jgi:ribosomal-protein-alanine N-acetyltransferase
MNSKHFTDADGTHLCKSHQWHANMTDHHTIVFETDRLFLRQQATGDLDELWSFHSNPENIRHYHDAPATLEEVREQLQWDLDWYQKNDHLGTWAIIHKETGKLVGLCSLMPWTVDGVEEVEMAYVLAEGCRGQGLGTELSRGVVHYALEKLQLPRIISLIEPENMLSRHVVEKAGMRFEKEGRDDTGPVVVYAINRTGWSGP